MADSLRDQLVKAGLATSAQAKKAERQQQAERHAQRRGKERPQGTDSDQARLRAKRQKAEQAKQDRERAKVRNEKYAAKALRAEIKQIILANDQRSKQSSDQDVPYNFVHGKKIKRVYVPPAQKTQLIEGSLVIVNNDGLYHFVSPAVAEQIAQRDPKRIIVAHQDSPGESTEDDEYYARFAVPDDLDW